jgi:DNA-binding transcriptional LysR family regulator
MIRRQDWALIGLSPQTAGPQSSAGGTVAKSFGELAALFPRSIAHPRDTLTLGVTCALNGDAGRRLLSVFRSRHPGVDLVIEDVDEVSLEAGLSDGTIDLVIAPTGAARGRWRATPLWRERLIAVLPQDHPLAAEAVVAPIELRHTAILLAGHKTGDRALQKAISRGLGGRPNGLMHYPVQRDTLFDLVALGFGVTISSQAALGAVYPGVCLRPIAGDAAQIGYDLYSDPDTDSESVRRFLAVIEDLAKGGIDDHPAQF